ncbi:hypothetical protein [Hymenobacter norwichensis]|uniref:hypothetical protein n=1 Tax=Hymenobacter norwichensis TaxID=223903 RepID=UPI0003B35EF9|nr:hypothetical protein [Hymenobacter norwichensis]
MAGSTVPFRWPTGDYVCGRDIGCAVSTYHFRNTIWASTSTTDMRNANHNFVRTFTYNNPAVLFGRTVSADARCRPTSPRLSRYLTTPPTYYANPATFLLKEVAGGTSAPAQLVSHSNSSL